MLEFDLIFAIMFMRLTMKMTKLILAIEMQMEGLNILNVLISKGAVSSFERIRGRESEMNNKINARVIYPSIVIYPEEKFTRKRVSKISRRKDIIIHKLQLPLNFMHTTASARWKTLIRSS